MNDKKLYMYSGVAIASAIVAYFLITKKSKTSGKDALIEQLITWSPTTKGKTDMVMALWFCEIRAREMLNQGLHKTHHMKNPFLSRQEVGKRTVINIDELLAEKDRTFI